MATFFGATEALRETQASASGPVRELEFGIKQFPESADDNCIPWVLEATQTHEPLDPFDFGVGYGLNNNENHDLDIEDDHDFDAEVDQDEEMEIRMLGLWYTNLLHILLGLALLCYPLMLRAWEVIATIQAKKHFLERGEGTRDDLLLVLKAYKALGIALGVVASVAYNPWRFRDQIWALEDGL